MKKNRILIVDDDHAMRLVLSESLESCGYETVEAENGNKALNQFYNRSFDLVVTDMIMPGMTGIEVLQGVKKLSPNIPVILITAFGTVNTAVEAKKEGAAEFIMKPFSFDDLEAIIKNVLNTYKNELIMKYAPLVKNVVGRLTFKLPIDSTDREGLVNVGIIGLMKALEKFDSTRNVQFETYARFRIRGAVLDELRSRDWVPRSVRHKYSKLEEAFHALKKNLRRPPTEDEVANYLEISLEQYFKLLDDAKVIPLISQEDLPLDYIEAHNVSDVVEAVECRNPLDLFVGKELKNLLKRSIDGLPLKEKKIISLYYYDEMTMKKIGMILDLTESRVYQLHTQAILHLRSTLRDLRH